MKSSPQSPGIHRSPPQNGQQFAASQWQRLGQTPATHRLQPMPDDRADGLQHLLQRLAGLLGAGLRLALVPSVSIQAFRPLPVLDPCSFLPS